MSAPGTLCVGNRGRLRAILRGAEGLWREGSRVAEVRVGKNESLDNALRRFKRKCQRSGVLAEVRRREHYEKPSVRRKKKAEAAKRRRFG